MSRMKEFLAALLICILSLPLAGCGVKVGDIRSVDSTKSLGVDTGIVAGKVKFIVDGNQMTYSLLTRPIMRLFRFSDGHYYESPMVAADGTFVWSLPQGDYEIAVLFGGMGPVGQAMLMRDTGRYMQVNGFTYPGYRFSSTPGRPSYLGTLVVDMNSRKMNALIDFTGERVFGSLNAIRVIDESADDANWRTIKNRPGAEIRLIESTTFRPGRDAINRR